MQCIRCPYCQQPARLVTGDMIYRRRPELKTRAYWQCKPCDAHVGCHEGLPHGRPFGTLANAELRRARVAAHAAFDPIWKDRAMGRAAAYRWLREQLGIPKRECHIAMFDLAQCARVVELCRPPRFLQ
jgi:hypothetical protein